MCAAIVGFSSLCHLVTWPLCHLVEAAVSHLVRFEGQLVDREGEPLEGPYALTFRLYNQPTGGTLLWEETQPQVLLHEGHFSVLLGEVTPLAVDWGQPVWFSTQVGTDVELLPRQQLTSVPLALRAEVAEALADPLPPARIRPQGSGSGLDADTLDGQHASAFFDRAHHTGTQAPATISPQGPSSGLDADTLDGHHASAFFSETVPWGRISGFPGDTTADTIADDGQITLGSETTGRYVQSMSGLSGDVQMVGEGGARITVSGNTITISGSTCTEDLLAIACALTWEDKKDSCEAYCPTTYKLVSWNCTSGMAGVSFEPTLLWGGLGQCYSSPTAKGSGYCQRICL